MALKNLGADTWTEAALLLNQNLSFFIFKTDVLPRTVYGIRAYTLVLQVLQVVVRQIDTFLACFLGKPLVSLQAPASWQWTQVLLWRAPVGTKHQIGLNHSLKLVVIFGQTAISLSPFTSPLCHALHSLFNHRCHRLRHQLTEHGTNLNAVCSHKTYHQRPKPH